MLRSITAARSAVVLALMLLFLVAMGVAIRRIHSGGSDHAHRPHGACRETLPAPAGSARGRRGRSASPKPVLVDFYADWCPPCRALLPALDDIAGQYEGPLSVKKLNVDGNPATRERYGITSIPALLFFKKGVINERIFGAQSRTAIAEAVARAEPVVRVRRPGAVKLYVTFGERESS